MAKVGAIAGSMYYMAMFFLLSTFVFGVTFIGTSMSSRFFKWSVEGCTAFGNGNVAGSNSVIVAFDLDMTVDIGWREFTVTSLDKGTETIGGCLDELKQGQSYPLGDYQVARPRLSLSLPLSCLPVLSSSLSKVFLVCQHVGNSMQLRGS